jgi:hypothetical protein
MNNNLFTQEITKSEILRTAMDKYIEDMYQANKDELYAIFEIINKEYKKTGKCLLCNGSRYSYNSKIMGAELGHFVIFNGLHSPCLAIQANYCPICGKNINEVVKDE